MDKRRKHGWPFWFAVTVILLPLLYVASFGPACWWLAGDISVGGVHYPQASRLYWPVGWVYVRWRGRVRNAVGWYATRRAEVVLLPTQPSGVSVTVARP